MATNGRPVTRINVNYGSLGTVAESRALSPVLIAPRYILHSHKEGYADSYLGMFDMTATEDKKLKNLPWPSVESRGTKVDTGSAKLYIKTPYIQINNTAISGTGAANSNKITLNEAIQGSDKSDSLGDFYVSVGDRVDITGTAGTVSAKVTGIGKTSTAAYVDTTPNKLNNTKSELVASGDFIGTVDCTYLVTIKEVGETDIVASVRALTGDYGYAADIVLGDTATAIGGFGVKIAKAAAASYTAGDAWVVSGICAKNTSSRIIYIDTILTSAETEPSCVFSSAKFSPEFVKVSDALTTTAGSVSVADNLEVVIGGVPYPVTAGEVYVDYREFVSEGSLSLVSASAQGVAEWAGVVDPQNPMGIMYGAASGVEGASFFLMATEGESAEDYIKAVNYVAQFEAAYAIVPYSNDPKVRAAVIASISKYASPEIAQFKRGWVASSVSSKVSVYPAEGETLLANMDAEGVVTLTSGNVITGGVAPGDFVVVYGDYDAETGSFEKAEYEIFEIVSDVQVRVYAGKDIQTSQIEFVRKLSNTDYAKAIAAEASSINAVRINMVWGDGVYALGYNNLPISVACAALAAQRSALPPHAPMTDMVVPGIITQDSLKFSDAEYEILNAGGVWVIHTNSDGNTVTYHQVTTRTDGTIAEEDSCVSNGDAVIRYFRSTIKSLFGGSMNVYDELIPTVESQLVATAESIKVLPFPEMYGPMLVNFTVNNIYRPDSNKGALVVDCDLEFVRPYAGGDFTFNLI